MRTLKVDVDGAGKRADVFLASKYLEFSRSSLEQLFEQGFVKLGKKTVKPGQKLQAGDVLKVDDKLLKQQPEAIEIPIIYEDDTVVVMNKPAGLLTHSKGALNNEATVATFLATKITDEDLKGNRAGIVHRLDRPTSGVIIGAKSEGAHKHLQKQFSNRKTKKTYVAVVEGIPKEAEALIDAPIGRNPKRPQTFRVHQDGKPAQTYYKVLKSFDDRSLLELKPVTGRTHQLRVHLSYIGHPIIGDHLYGREGEPMLLHAKELEITLPSSERRIFEADLPDGFKKYLK